MDGVPVELTATEYRLLAALIRHRGQVLSPVKLLELAWSDPFGVGPERVKYSVMRLRRKLGASADGRPVHRGGPRLRLPLPGRRHVLTEAAEAPQPSSTGKATAGRHVDQARSAFHGFTPSAPESRETASRGRVLLVEDDPESAIFCTYVLRSGAGSMSPISPTRPSPSPLPLTRPWDLVITDLDLPIMSGLEFVAALRRMAPRLPVVLVTAFPHLAPPRWRRSRPQPDALLAKPFRPTSCSARPPRWRGRQRSPERTSPRIRPTRCSRCRCPTRQPGRQAQAARRRSKCVIPNGPVLRVVRLRSRRTALSPPGALSLLWSHG